MSGITVYFGGQNLDVTVAHLIGIGVVFNSDPKGLAKAGVQ